MKNRRRLVLAPLAAATVLLAFASAAYACTIIVGKIETKVGTQTCPNTASPGNPLCEVNPGDTITSTGWDLGDRSDWIPQRPGDGAPAGTMWGLYILDHKEYQDSMKTCMAQLARPTERKIGPTTEQSAANNGSVTISGTIPAPTDVETTYEQLPVVGGQGPALVCLSSESPDPITGEYGLDYNYATPPTELEVL